MNPSHKKDLPSFKNFGGLCLCCIICEIKLIKQSVIKKAPVETGAGYQN